MKAIISKYLPPGVTRSARYVASDGDGNRVSVPVDPNLDLDGNHREAVQKLCRKLNWQGVLVEGTLMRGGHDVCRVWVWRQEQHAVAPEFAVGFDRVVHGLTSHSSRHPEPSERCEKLWCGRCKDWFWVV